MSWSPLLLSSPRSNCSLRSATAFIIILSQWPPPPPSSGPPCSCLPTQTATTQDLLFARRRCSDSSHLWRLKRWLDVFPFLTFPSSSCSRFRGAKSDSLAHPTGMWNSHADIVHISTFINASPVCADKDEAPNSDLPEESLPRAKNDSSAYSALRCPSSPRGQSTTSDRGCSADGRGFPGSEDAARRPPPRVPLSDGGREMNICTYLLIRRRERREGER